ncbi:YtxH domain-containing protein [Paenibacillus abyssi]|uniref:General stress protein n=1 Tax=Paenibacillus abyssi TaxID=1340531 RepID=A0A917CQZ0_9BACL|nr:YtxH domain-containing protein [Paenibacillus abyssi]GGF95640.1 hypothetical protein GCM10010916_11170 [Paenibacillus abyssi]
MENMEKELPIKTENGMMKGALIGGLIGAAAALLFAPKAGRELRSDLRVKAGEATDVVKAKGAIMAETAQGAVKAVGEQATLLKGKVQDIAASAKQRAADTASQAHELVDTVADKARETANVIGMRGKEAIDTAESKAHETIDQAESKAEDPSANKSPNKANTAANTTNTAAKTAEKH